MPVTSFTTPVIYPREFMEHVEAQARALPRDPGPDFEGACQLFGVSYGDDFWWIRCRGRCPAGGRCTLQISFDGPTDVEFRPGRFTVECVCAPPRATKTVAKKEPTSAKPTQAAKKPAAKKPAAKKPAAKKPAAKKPAANAPAKSRR